MSTQVHNDLGRSGIAATHDSPIRHEGKFDWRAHIGKGEGNASFGAGTYLSTANGVHRSYKNQFTAMIDETTAKLEQISLELTDGWDTGAVSGALTSARDKNMSLSAAKAKVVAAVEAVDDTDGMITVAVKRRLDGGMYDQDIYEIIHRKIDAVSPTYHVTVNAKQDELLDWDSFLSSQGNLPDPAKEAAVKAFAKSAYAKAMSIGEDIVGIGEYSVRVYRGMIVGIGHYYGDFIEKSARGFDEVVTKAALSTMTGEDLYNGLKTELGSQAKASDYLQSLGIVGHVYDAAGGNESNFRNYVIYDDSRIQTNYVSFNQQTTLGTKATPEQVQAARDHVLKTVGDKVKVEVKKLGNISGSWSRKNDQTVIRLAINGDVLSTAYHESMHEFFSILKRNGDEAVQTLLQRVATNPIMKRKLERLLAEQPAAQAQLNDPEEAAAYMYQFWRNGDLKLGPETKTFFEKIKALLNKALGLISSSVRQQNIEAKRAENDLLTAQATVEAFTEGMFADESQHAANVKAMSAEIEKVNKVNEQLGKALTEAMSKYGKLVFSAEAMMDLTDNPHFIAISRAFNQKAGDAMRHFKNGAVGSFFDATRAETDKRMNQLRTLLSHYEAEDLELARAFMSKRDVKGYKGPIWPTDHVTREIVEKIDGFFEGMAKYISDSDVKRLEMRDGKPHWVSIQMRKNYWPRVFDYDVLREQGAEFQADLLKHHGDKIEEMVKEANEAANGGEAVTAESIAEAIWMRSMNNGTIDLDETTSNLGITPAASAVNRRQLDFLDMSVFDKYMSKDLPNVLTTYTRSIVKRAEYQKRFGNGGEKIQEASDKGFLHEMGGEDLVKRTVEALPKAQEAWVKAGGKKSGEPYPTLRSVGFRLHRDEVGQQAHNEAVIAASAKLEQALKAVQAMEGTLGNNISPELRQANSWIVTYQNFRLLSTMIFTSFNDVNGVVINGGTMKDAWDTFVGGLKGVKDSYTNGDSDAQMRDAEMWGTVDAGSTMDAIGQTYGSVWMSGKAKKMSDAFFKYTGAEGWNRGIRSVATTVAQRTIKRMAVDPSYMTEPAKKAQFERLFGKGASPQDIKLLPNGELDPSDQRNVAAVNRWVLDAIPAPNASHRPIWGSDPHYQTFIHLKNYTYTWHRTILQSAIEQARLGNLRPAAVAALGYIPIAIAAGAIKGMLMPGDEPAWMKQGLSGWLKYGVMVGGIGGVPQMYANDLLEGDVAKLLGPMFDQLQDAATIPLGEASLINAGPVDVGWRDHKAVVETLGALPGGTMWKRWGY